MAFRVAASLQEGIRRLPLRQGENVVGSQPGSDIMLDHPSVSRRHARIIVNGSQVTIEDLSSSNGTLVGSRRIRAEVVAAGEPIYFGRVFAFLEEVADGDTEVAIPLTGAVARRASNDAGGVTAQMAPVETFTLDYLPALLDRLTTGTTAAELAGNLGEALHRTLPAAAIEVLDGQGLLFQAGIAVLSESIEVRRGSVDGPNVRAQFASPALAHAYTPIVAIAASLLRLAGSPRQRPRVDPTPLGVPDPPSLVPSVIRVYEDAQRVAAGNVSVLITGESGTGKEVLARFIHEASPWASGPLVTLNCAALPKDLLESELFGIERGVATGVDARPGKFELADGGTLFLDEIGDMSIEMQARILRVLQEHEVFRLGSRQPRPARARIVAATNRPIAQLMAAGEFREDLYHRIATWVVELPPLRRRRADILNLAAWFLAREAHRAGKRISGISRRAADALAAYAWPGNIRQLEHEMARAILFLDDGDTLDTLRLHASVIAAADPATTRLDDLLAAAERDAIAAALGATNGDVESAADRLGVSRATLYRRLKALGLEPDAP